MSFTPEIDAEEIQITATSRWTRTSFREGGDWVQVDCFCFTAPDGTRSYADGLFPAQSEIFTRQEAARATLTEQAA